MEKGFLYHYTSIETLALILKNKTICFNNLLNVDDLEEVMSEDMGKFGKYVNVSCWTEDSEESIPLWNLYTSDMKGVRIRMPEYPFKKYHHSAEKYNISEDVDTYIDLNLIHNMDFESILSINPSLCKVKYTNDENKIFPKIRQCSDYDALKEFIITGESNGKEISVSYCFDDIGVYKRSNWSFQKEWRYIIKTSPINTYKNPSNDMIREFLRKIEDNESPAPFDKIFLSIDEKCFDKMEILVGPKATDGDKIIIKALVDQYAPKATVKDSKLKIKSK